MSKTRICSRYQPDAPPLLDFSWLPHKLSSSIKQKSIEHSAKLRLQLADRKRECSLIAHDHVHDYG